MRALARHAPALVVAMIFLVPLLVMITGSLRPVDLAPPVGLELFPPQPTLDSYVRLAELVPLWSWLANSALVVAVAVPITVLVASWAAFGIRLLDRRARRIAIVTVVALLLVPETMPALLIATGAMLSLHTAANLVLFPWGYDSDVQAPNDEGLRAHAFRASHYNGYVTGQPGEVLYNASGTTDDWTYDILGIASGTWELGPGSGTCAGLPP